MKITCWSDYACPYCCIGETRLKEALLTAMQEEAEDAKAGQPAEGMTCGPDGCRLG